MAKAQTTFAADLQMLRKRLAGHFRKARDCSAACANTFSEIMSSTIAKLFEGSRWLSEKLFAVLKLFSALLLVVFLASTLGHVIEDRGKVSIKPFSVPEDMEKHHEGAGSIIANIVKQKLINKRAELDSIIAGSEEKPDQARREETIVTNDNAFMKMENVKVPETAISINDVVEFLSALVGRKDITGSVYEDSNRLYLQIAVSGEIFTVYRDFDGNAEGASNDERERNRSVEKNGKLSEKEEESPLRIQVIEGMAEEAVHQILVRASEKHRLYYTCTNETKYRNDDYKKKAFKTLHALCANIYAKWPDVPQHVKEALQERVTQEQLPKQFLAYERTILNSLRNNVLKDNVRPTVIDPEQEASAAEPQLFSAQEKPGVAGSSMYASQSSATENDSTQKDGNEPRVQRESKEYFQKLADRCDGSRNSLKSNLAEEQATIYYTQDEFASAYGKYKEAIEENCRNPFAWANLGVLLSDLASGDDVFDVEVAELALKRALDFKPRTGWIWNSLCIVNAYKRESSLEEAFNSYPCRQARSLERSKQLVYDKLFYVKIAQRYSQLGDDTKAFRFFTAAIRLDPKRTCLLRDVVEHVDSIIAKAGGSDKKKEDHLNSEMCKALEGAYPSTDADEQCEKYLTDRIKRCELPN